MTIGALSAKGAFQAWAGAFAGQLDQTNVTHRQKLRSRRVAGKLLGQGVKDQLPVFGILHIDEIDHDDPTEVAETQLTHDLDLRLEVQSKDRVLERLRADIFAGVDIDHHQRLGLVDDQIPSAFEPDLGSQYLLELTVDTERVHQIGCLPK